MHRRAAVPVERRDIAVVDRYGSVAARDHHLVALAPTLEDRAGRDAAAEMNHRLVDELDMDRLIVLGEPRLEDLRKATPIISEEHTSDLQSLMRSSDAICCLKKETSYSNKLSQILFHMLRPELLVFTYTAI